MRRFMIVLIVGTMGIIVGCSSAGQGPMSTSMSDPSVTAVQSAIQQLDPADFSAQLPERVTINVHTPDEGALPETDLTIPYNQISDRQGEFPPDRSTKIAIYCMTGSMSAIAGRTLKGLGYTDIVELRGGMQAWRAAGLPFIAAD